MIGGETVVVAASAAVCAAADLWVAGRGQPPAPMKIVANYIYVGSYNRMVM